MSKKSGGRIDLTRRSDTWAVLVGSSFPRVAHFVNIGGGVASHPRCGARIKVRSDVAGPIVLFEGSFPRCPKCEAAG